MKKYAPLALAVLLAAAGCGRYEVYERNLQYMNASTYQAEKATVAKQTEEAREALNKAETSGNPAEIRKARETYKEVMGRARAIEMEDHRRSRTW